MKAAVYQGNRQIGIAVSDRRPPRPGEVRIAVSHCGICGTDLHIFLGDLDRRVRPPQVIGHEVSGVIEETGEGVSGWQPGDRVTVLPVVSCGACATCLAGHAHVCPQLKVLGVDAMGGMQRYWNAPAANLFRLPDSLPLAHGALIEPLAVACHDVRLAALRPGEKVLIIGGGPIGALCALVARHAGAAVAVVEVNPFRVELLRKMHLAVVNPKETDAGKFVQDWAGPEGADVAFEVSGTQAGADLMAAALRPKGRVVLVSVYAFRPQVDLYRFFARELTLLGVRLYDASDFRQALELAAAGVIPTDTFLTATRPIDEVQQAFEDLASGGNSMKVLIDCRA